jgi:adenylate cyclase class 2
MWPISLSIARNDSRLKWAESVSECKSGRHRAMSVARKGKKVRLEAGVKETEIKLRIADVPQMRQRLTKIGFRAVRTRRFEDNWVFDFPDHRLGRAQCLLRLRRFGKESLITFKGPVEKNLHYKTREEIETSVADADLLRGIFLKMGLRECFRYQKWRTVFQNPKDLSGHVLLDETPIGYFLEIEGASRWIDRVALMLGFTRDQHILKSYAILFFESCAATGIHSSSMVFDSPISAGRNRR